jgi:hypothetical protein
MKNQRRFQVHGNKSILLDSEDRSEDDPLPALKAHQLLNALESRVEESHSKDHAVLEKEAAFAKTHDLIDRVAINKGCGPHKWSWPKPSRRDQRRVDTEITVAVGGRSYSGKERGYG